MKGGISLFRLGFRVDHCRFPGALSQKPCSFGVATLVAGGLERLSCRISAKPATCSTAQNHKELTCDTFMAQAMNAHLGIAIHFLLETKSAATWSLDVQGLVRNHDRVLRPRDRESEGY